MRRFRAHPLLAGAHAQTVLGAVTRFARPLPTRRLWVDTPLGDALAVDYLPGPPGRPVLLILHGIAGSSQADGVRYLMQRARARLPVGLAALNLRGCDGPARVPRLYHGGSSDDLEATVHGLLEKLQLPLLIAGLSLGANILLKWLGERGSRVPAEVLGTCGVSCPFQLDGCARQLERSPIHRLYRYNLVRQLKSRARQVERSFPGSLDRERLESSRTFFDFDEHVTARLHGFASARHYWEECSSRRWLKGIERPTLLVSSQDDPFLEEGSLPDPTRLDNPHLVADFPSQGGHLGFVGPDWRPWVEERVLSWFGEFL